MIKEIYAPSSSYPKASTWLFIQSKKITRVLSCMTWCIISNLMYLLHIVYELFFSNNNMLTHTLTPIGSHSYNNIRFHASLAFSSLHYPSSISDQKSHNGRHGHWHRLWRRFPGINNIKDSNACAQCNLLITSCSSFIVLYKLGFQFCSIAGLFALLLYSWKSE